MRCRVAELRLVIFQRDGGCCKRCGVNLVELAAAFQSYENIWFRKLKAPGVPDVQRNRIWAWTSHWPTPSDFQKAVGFASAGHLWEMNHILALAEGGDPVDPDNLETLCLRCHRLHTSALAGRLAKAKRRTAKFHNGVTA